mmetsp:Transcript_12690/g.29996  ORF Transcript_12690/g.29996 Transcript_12690/m.29996 type:complete len:90 (-) Transcript_12690:110-379(-)
MTVYAGLPNNTPVYHNMPTTIPPAIFNTANAQQQKRSVLLLRSGDSCGSGSFRKLSSAIDLEYEEDGDMVLAIPIDPSLDRRIDSEEEL